MNLYEYYKYAPHQLDYGIFYETVLILNPIYKVQNYG